MCFTMYLLHSTSFYETPFQLTSSSFTELQHQSYRVQGHQRVIPLFPSHWHHSHPSATTKPKHKTCVKPTGTCFIHGTPLFIKPCFKHGTPLLIKPCFIHGTPLLIKPCIISKGGPCMKQVPVVRPLNIAFLKMIL